METIDRRAQLALAAWVGSLLLAIALFTWMGAGRLAAPAVTDPGSWATWAAAREPAEVAFAIGRLLVLALAWYLVGVTTLGALARWARWLRLVRVADALAIPSVRRLLQASLGLGLATAAVASSTVPIAPPARAPIAGGPGIHAAATTEADQAHETDEDVADVGVEERLVAREVAVPGPSGSVVLDGDPVHDPVWHLQDVRPEVAGPVEAATVADPVAVEVAGEEYVVLAGDHFWSIAERVVADALGRDGGDAEVDPYWRRLVDANRDRLVNPRDPDLILPGQRFVLPAYGA